MRATRLLAVLVSFSLWSCGVERRPSALDADDVDDAEELAATDDGAEEAALVSQELTATTPSNTRHRGGPSHHGCHHPHHWLDDDADGWAAASDAGVPTGGLDADAGHVYLVRNRTELIRALYPDAVIADAGTFTSAAGADPSPKIIYVVGKINLSTNLAGARLGEADYAVAPYDFQTYVDTYKPSVWTANPANFDSVAKRPRPLTGAQETARLASAAKQAAVVRIRLGSNTSIVGLGRHARFVNGGLLIPAGVSNVIIRNVTFKDAFDSFAAWDPTDSFSIRTTEPGCQLAYGPGAGPQFCPGGRWNSNYDLLSITGGQRVWVDHCTFSDGYRRDDLFPSVFDAPQTGEVYRVQHHDGAIDITNTSNFVTVSNSLFHHHDKTHLVGGSDTATVANGFGALNVTFHDNLYEQVGQRLPRVRFGKVHVFNNVYRGDVAGADYRFQYAIGVGYLARIWSENNVLVLTDSSGAVVTTSSAVSVFHKASPTSGSGLDVGQQTYFFDNGTTFNGAATTLFSDANAAAASGGRPALLRTDAVWVPSTTYSYTLRPTAHVERAVEAEAGAGRSLCQGWCRRP
jgi:pectate lyase